MKVRRKIVALGTALAMAFVMIASLVMVTDVKADDSAISGADVTFKVPNVGDVISKDENDMPTPMAEVSTTNENLNVVAYWKTGDKIYSVDGDESPGFFGEFEEGETYYLMVDFEAKIGYTLADTFADNVKVNGNAPVKKGTVNGSYNQCVFSFQAKTAGGGTDPSEDPKVDPTSPTEDTSTVTTVTDGSSATIAPSEDGTLSFRIDKPLSYFEDGGELYIDGTLIERSQYTYKEGSTIITLVKELASKLSDGAAHVFKVKFNDGTEVTSNITVGTAAAASSTAATTGTAASSTAATTTKVTSPKTADVLPIAGIALVFVGATAIGVIAIRRKNS